MLTRGSEFVTEWIMFKDSVGLFFFVAYCSKILEIDERYRMRQCTFSEISVKNESWVKYLIQFNLGETNNK